MNELQQTKVVACIPPGAIKDDASFTAVEIDGKDWDWLTIIIAFGATDIAMAALKLQESETSGGGGGYTDVTGAIFGTSTNIAGSTSALPTSNDDNKVFLIEVDLRKRMRYLNLLATAGNGSAGTYMAAVGILSRGKAVGITAAARGAGDILRV